MKNNTSKKLPHFHWRRYPKNEVLDEFTDFAEKFLPLFIKHGSGRLYFVDLLDLEYSLADLLRNLFKEQNDKPVSYTHLTLPTNREV